MHMQTHGPFMGVSSLTWAILEKLKRKNGQCDQSAKKFTLENFPLYYAQLHLMTVMCTYDLNVHLLRLSPQCHAFV